MPSASHQIIPSASSGYFSSSDSPWLVVNVEPHLMTHLIVLNASQQQIMDQLPIELEMFRQVSQGDWVPVVVDDWIPCESPGKPAFSTSRKGNEMWVSLLEKAYAKLHSSYEALEGGLVQDALVDLTGGAGEEIDMRSAEAQIDLASGRLGQTMEFFGCLDKISRYILGVSFLRTTAGVRNYQSSHDSMMFYIGMRILKTRGRRAAYNIYLHESVGGTDYVNSREISCEMVLDPDPKGMPNSPTLLLTGIERGERMVCPLRMDEASCLILGSPSLLNVISAWVLEVSKANRRKMVH
ncbi:hypothetical protein BC332_34157 [Capsicum chinense]|nr:hypothetical protein BC332_34157 [Capsicum chinense]